MTTTSAPTPFRAGFFRRSRPAAPADVGRAVYAALRTLGEHHCAPGSWYAMDPGFRVRRCSRLEDVVAQIESGEIEWDDGMRSPSAPSHRVRFFNGKARDRLADVVIAFALDGDPRGPYWGLRIDIGLGAAFAHGSTAEGAQGLTTLFLSCVRSVAPDWAFLGTAKVPARMDHRVAAGWLTYVAGDELPGRTPPNPATTAPVDGIGHLVVAHPDVMRDDVPAHLSALRKVQRALDGEDDASLPLAAGECGESESRWTRWAGAQGGRLASTADPDTSAIIAALARGSLPFVRPDQQGPAGADVDFSLLPLETYASVSGALARGEPWAETFARHNVSPETFERLARAWARRLQDEPHLLARFRTLAKGGA
jgi:hypothetical protein